MNRVIDDVMILNLDFTVFISTSKFFYLVR